MAEKLVFGDPSQIKEARARRRSGGGVPVPHRTTSFWRIKAREVIAQTFADHAGSDESALKLALFDAYPFGLREYTPYKLWLQEVKAALANRRK